MNQTYVKALKAAKSCLEESKYICIALARAASEDKITEKEYLITQAMILRRLGMYFTLNSWLRAQGIDVNSYEDCDQIMLDYRFRWIDSMIAEFSVWVKPVIKRYIHRDGFAGPSAGALCFEVKDGRGAVIFRDKEPIPCPGVTEDDIARYVELGWWIEV